jgi:isopentenyl-diphosphate delta-isomerase
VFLFNEKNELLLQRRSSHKITFPNMWTNTCCSHPLYDPEEMIVDGPIAYQGVKTAAVRRMDYELNMKNVLQKDYNMLTKILYRANTDAKWAEYELDYILFAKKHSDEIEFDANPNEISHTEYVTRDNILDFLEAEVSTGTSEITPWFNMILQTKLFDWWDHLNDKGSIPSEDTSGHIIDYIRGVHAVDVESIPSIVEYKKNFYKSKSGARSFSTSINRDSVSGNLAYSEMNLSNIDKSKMDRKDIKLLRAEERKMKQQAEFFSQQIKDMDDPCASQFGEKDLLEIYESGEQVKITSVSEIDESKIGQNVTIRGRIHKIRAKGGSCFLIVRESGGKISTIQCGLFTSTTSKGMLNYVKRIPNESVIEIKGQVVTPEQEVKSCTQNVEVMVDEVWLLDKADF